MSNFLTLKKINVNDHIEKKNNLSYLSWAWAVDQLLTNDPNATWSYGQPVSFGETLMVFCTVKAFDKEMTAQLPVMDYRNKAIPNPDAMAVNTAMQRCLAKAIALHGIGLYIYAGEDLPEIDSNDLINQLNECKTLNELQNVYKQMFKQNQNNPELLKQITTAKDMVKSKLGV
jgi:hypothetical protein